MSRSQMGAQRQRGNCIIFPLRQKKKKKKKWSLSPQAFQCWPPNCALTRLGINPCLTDSAPVLRTLH